MPPPGRSNPVTAGRGNAEGYALSGTALSLRGAPYRDGGADPAGFDCSGFVRYVYEQHGVAMPRQVRDQFRVGKSVDRDQLEPGDLVFFSTVAPGASHVGIVIGGDQFVHAPSERGVVRVESLGAQYLGEPLYRRKEGELELSAEARDVHGRRPFRSCWTAAAESGTAPASESLAVQAVWRWLALVSPAEAARAACTASFSR